MALYRLKRGCGPHRKKVEGVMKKLVPGDEVELTSQEVVAFKDKFELVGPPPPDPEDQIPSVGLTLQHQGGGKYNVFNEATKEFINDELLTKKEAESLISDVAKAEEGIEPGKDSVLGKLLFNLRNKEEKEETPNLDEENMQGDKENQEQKEDEETVEDGPEPKNDKETKKDESTKVESPKDLAGKNRVPRRRRSVSKKGKSKSDKK